MILKSMPHQSSFRSHTRIIASAPAFILVMFALLGCSAPRGSVQYREGNPNSLVFTLPISEGQRVTGSYYAVKRDKNGLVRQVWQYDKKGKVIGKFQYTWEDTTLLTRRDRYYNSKRKLHSIVEWHLVNGRPVEKHESFYDKQGQYEKLVTTRVNKEGKPIYEELFGSGRKLEQTTEYYYDPGKRLDKKVVTYFLPNGDKRDFWVTLYTNFNTIRSEERYLMNGTLISFYRNSYDVLDNHLTRSEAFNEETEELVIKDFDPDGRLIREELLTRTRVSKRTHTWAFDEKPGMVIERSFDRTGKLIKEQSRPVIGEKPSLGDLKRLTPTPSP